MESSMLGIPEKPEKQTLSEGESGQQAHSIEAKGQRYFSEIGKPQ
jgi:hypothetical protein